MGNSEIRAKAFTSTKEERPLGKSEGRTVYTQEERALEKECENNVSKCEKQVESKQLQEETKTRAIPFSMDRSRKRLIEKAMKGNRTALSKVIRLYYKDILYFAAKTIGSQKGEDVAQQAIISIVSNLSRLRDPEKIKPWMFMIVRSECVKHIKKEKMGKEALIINSDTVDQSQSLLEEGGVGYLPETSCIDEENRTHILKLIDAMPRSYADCIRLFYYDGLSYQEIAEVLEVSEIKVRNDLFRGRMLFKERYEEEGVVHKFGAASLVSFAVLSQVFEAEQLSIVTPEMLMRTGAWLQNHAGLSLHSSFPSSVVQGASHMGGKIALGVVAAGSVAAGVGAYAAHEAPQQPATAIVQTEEEQPIQEAPQATYEEVPITTLSEMIGVDEAVQLEAFSTGVVDKDAWQTFLHSLGVSQQDVAFETSHRYTIYELCKQDKQLLIFERVELASGNTEVKYQFGVRQELPYILEVSFMFS